MTTTCVVPTRSRPGRYQIIAVTQKKTEIQQVEQQRRLASLCYQYSCGATFSPPSGSDLP